MRVILRLMLPVLLASCTSSSPRTSEASLRTAARAWAKAYLTGSLDDIRRMEGPECAPSTTTSIDRAIAGDSLRQTRSFMAQHFGLPLDQIHVRRVLVRDVAASSGEVMADYGLPPSVVGNDNWVTYAKHGRRWLVADCHAPIGGESVSSSASTP